MTTEATWSSALLDPELPLPSGIVTWNGSDPHKRFAVYRNNVIVSLVDALAGTFAVTQALVGDIFFRAMAREFVRAFLPHSPVLAFYGRNFPAFIAGFPAAATLPYLPDVARLEMAYVEAFHAADATPVAPKALQRVLNDPESLPQLRLALHPSLATICSSFAIVSLWAAHQGLADITTINPAMPENAWVLRAGLAVQVYACRQATAASFYPCRLACHWERRRLRRWQTMLPLI
ncbi:MAG: DNA-binding domain-containing protein [Nitrosospira sp.]